MSSFFANSDLLDYMVLRPLSHMCLSWEMKWDTEANEYVDEPGTFAAHLNRLIRQLESTEAPTRYHDSEDRLAEFVIEHLHWNIRKEGQRWVGEEYAVVLQQGSFHDIDERLCILAAAGRIKAARDRGQNHFDDMEKSHRRVLAAVMSTVIWQRASIVGQ